MIKTLFTLSSLIILGCVDKKPNTKVKEIKKEVKIEVEDKPETAKLKYTSFEEISKFVIATIFNQEGNKTLKSEFRDDSYLVKYTRNSDNTVWQYLVKFEGHRAIWASNGGRWRTDPQDEKIYFEEKPDKVNITQDFSDGSSIVKEFKINTK